MTGLDRLREYATDLSGKAGFRFAQEYGRDLMDIHRQIWSEHADELARIQQDFDNRRSELCSAIGISADTGWSDAMSELDKRLMPEGIEWLLEVWPKWSNGEYCKFGDWWTAKNYGEDEPKQFRKLSIYTPEQLREWEQDDGDEFGYEWDFMRPSDPKYRPDKVDQPAPAVLAADGEPLEVGQVVWNVHTNDELVVDSFDGSLIETHNPDGLPVTILSPSYLTHQRPVLDADGVPIKNGDEVWNAITDGGPFTVKEVEADSDSDNQKSTVWCGEYAANGYRIYRIANQLTHTKPEPDDSWERLEEDARELDINLDGENTSDYPRMSCVRDIVRRAKALAERGK